MLFCVAVLTLRPPATGALHNYTDHQRHAAYAYALLERGPAVYLATTGELVEHSAFRHPVHEWLRTRYLYPPGPLLLFVPLALIGQETPISTGAFRRLCGAFVAVLVHIGLWFGLVRMLVLPRGWSVLAAVMIWAYCLRCALCAQYEPLWFAPAALLLGALEGRRFDHALGWLALAWMTHYRAVVLLPLGILAAVQLLRSRQPGHRRWILLVAAAAGIGGVCFLLGVQAPIRTGQPLVMTPGDGRFPLAIGATLTGIGLSIAVGDSVLAAVVGLIGLTGLADVGHFWHASAIFVPLMSRDAAAIWRRPTLATVGFLIWASAMRFVWIDRPLALFRDLRELALHIPGPASAMPSEGAHPAAAREGPAGRTRMIVLPLTRLVGLKAATASSRVATMPMFVRTRPSRARRTISLSWARSGTTTKSTVRPSAGRASVGPVMVTSVPPARIRLADRFAMSPPRTSKTRSTPPTSSRASLSRSTNSCAPKSRAV